ncbi:hypothetical protein SUGI_0344160 [Cryptomeria japonica]|nr:hypothetical protein SUGI_0344160 [Cryptomeria japonica]
MKKQTLEIMIPHIKKLKGQIVFDDEECKISPTEIDEAPIEFFSIEVPELALVGDECKEGSVVEKGRVDVAAVILM